MVRRSSFLKLILKPPRLIQPPTAWCSTHRFVGRCPSFSNWASLLNGHRENTAMQIDANAAVFYMQISHVNPPTFLFFGLVMPFYQFVCICGEKNADLHKTLKTPSCNFWMYPLQGLFVRILLPHKLDCQKNLHRWFFFFYKH